MIEVLVAALALQVSDQLSRSELADALGIDIDVPVHFAEPPHSRCAMEHYNARQCARCDEVLISASMDLSDFDRTIQPQLTTGWARPAQPLLMDGAPQPRHSRTAYRLTRRSPLPIIPIDAKGEPMTIDYCSLTGSLHVRRTEAEKTARITVRTFRNRLQP